MKILLDNCVDRRLSRSLPEHQVDHTSRVGLSTASNGDLLLAAADRGYDVLVTVDQKIRHEHNLALLPVAVLELDTRDSRLPALQAMSPHFPAALIQTQTHRFVSINQAGQITCQA